MSAPLLPLAEPALILAQAAGTELAPPKQISADEFRLILALMYLPPMAGTGLLLVPILRWRRGWRWSRAVLGAVLYMPVVLVLGTFATLLTVPFVVGPYIAALAVLGLNLVIPRLGRRRAALAS